MAKRELLKLPGTGTGWYRRWTCAHLGGSLFLVFLNLWVAVPRPGTEDPMGYYAWAESVMDDGDIDPSNQLAGNSNSAVIQVNGRPVRNNRYGIGWTLVALPFMAAGRAAGVTVNAAAGTRLAHDGRSALVVRMAWLGIGLFATLGLLAAHEVTRRVFDPPVAFWSVLLAWAGTSAFVYTWKAPALSHPVSLASIAISYWMAVLCAERPSWKYPFLMGLAGGLAVATRLVDLPLLLPALLLVGGNRAWMRVLLAAAGFAIPVGIQVAVWKTVYGVFYFNGYAANGEGFSPSVYYTLKVLFSSRHGLFFWHPVTLLCVAGLTMAIVHRARWRGLAAAILAVLAFQSLLYGSWSSWSLGWSYGARWAADGLILWALGLGAFLHYARSWPLHGAVYVLCAVFVAVSVLLIAGQILLVVPPDAPLHIGAFELF
jgi:hypothetical protein